MNTLEYLKAYKPINDQEKYDKEAMITFIERNDDFLLRSNLAGHFTASAIIVNKERTKVLFAHHNIYNSWAWVGGHMDGDDDPLYVAIKEAKEETGLVNVMPVSDQIAGIDTVYVMPHIKNGAHISDHLHFNITFILEADETEEVSAKEDENSGVRWFLFEEVYDYVSEPRMVPIYTKLINVAKSL